MPKRLDQLLARPCNLRARIEAVRDEIHAVLADNGIQFADLPKTVQDPPHHGVAIRSIALADSTASSIGSPSRTFPGRTARSNE